MFGTLAPPKAQKGGHFFPLRVLISLVLSSPITIIFYSLLPSPRPQDLLTPVLIPCSSWNRLLFFPLKISFGRRQAEAVPLEGPSLGIRAPCSTPVRHSLEMMTLVTRFPSRGLSLHICEIRVGICKTPLGPFVAPSVCVGSLCFQAGFAFMIFNIF